LNEDLSTDDGFHDQPVQFPVVNLGRNRPVENITNDNEQEKLIKKSNDNSHSDTLTELTQQTNTNTNEFLHPPHPNQQHRSLNDLSNPTLPTTIQKQNKPLRKKTKLNIIVEPSSHLNINKEQIHPITRTPSSSSNQTTSNLIRTNNQKIKPKAITPLGYYPNQEQIRAHINRSVIERQHPSYLSIPSNKGVIQQTVPFHVSPSKVNNILFRQQKQLDPSIQEDHSTIKKLHVAPSRQIKQTLPGLYNEEIIDDHRKEKRRLNDRNKWQENSQKEQVQIKSIFLYY